MITGPRQVSANNQHFLSFIQQDSNELHVCLISSLTLYSSGISEARPSVFSDLSHPLPKERTVQALKVVMSGSPP